MTFNEMYDILRDYVDVSDEALGLACGLCGQNTETMERVLYYFTGWHSFEGYMEEIEGE